MLSDSFSHSVLKLAAKEDFESEDVENGQEEEEEKDAENEEGEEQAEEEEEEEEVGEEDGDGEEQGALQDERGQAPDHSQTAPYCAQDGHSLSELDVGDSPPASMGPESVSHALRQCWNATATCLAFMGKERVPLTVQAVKDVERILASRDSVTRMLSHMEKLFKEGYEVSMYFILDFGWKGACASHFAYSEGCWDDVGNLGNSFKEAFAYGETILWATWGAYLMPWLLTERSASPWLRHR